MHFRFILPNAALRFRLSGIPPSAESKKRDIPKSGISTPAVGRGLGTANEPRHHRHAERSPDAFYRDEVEACSARSRLRLHLDPNAVEIPFSMTWVHCSTSVTQRNFAPPTLQLHKSCTVHI